MNDSYVVLHQILDLSVDLKSKMAATGAQSLSSEPMRVKCTQLNLGNFSYTEEILDMDDDMIVLNIKTVILVLI